jgi:hypothetical protein
MFFTLLSIGVGLDEVGNDVVGELLEAAQFATKLDGARELLEVLAQDLFMDVLIDVEPRRLRISCSVEFGTQKKCWRT